MLVVEENLQIPPLRSGSLLSCLGLTRRAERVEESENWKGLVKAAVDPSTELQSSSCQLRSNGDAHV